jgi:RNA polymerase sigma factor (TIGR02999 family)
MPRSPQAVTRLLEQARAGKADALTELFPLVYGELRALAARQIRREHGRRSIQATDLVHEAYVRLVPDRNLDWKDRAHFFAIAARSMRQVLIDRARARKAQKRGGTAEPGTLTDELLDRVEAGGERGGHPVDLIALDVALGKLAALDRRYAEVVELRFFGGLSIEEAAEVLSTSPATLKRWWAFAQAWLRRELSA